MREALRAALAEEFATGPRTLLVGIIREKEPHEMLTALGIDEVGPPRLLPAAERARARSHAVADAAIELGFPEEQIEIAESVGEAVTLALLSTPEEGQVVITGSLYVVGAARSILVKH